MLGVILFGITTVFAFWLVGRAAYSGSQIPFARIVILEASCVGLISNTEVGLSLYVLMSAAIPVITLAIGTFFVAERGWKYVWCSVAAMSATYVLFLAMFAFQPAPPMAAMWIVVPGLISFIPPINRRLRLYFDSARAKAQAGIMTREERLAYEKRKAERAEWLARR